MNTVTTPEQTVQKKKPGFWAMTHAIKGVREGNFEPLQTLCAEQGDFFRGRFGPFRVVMLNHPDYVEELVVKKHKNFHKDRGANFLRKVLGNGLLTSEEAFHLRNRRMIQPAFHKKRIDEYGRWMVHYAEAMSDSWEDGAHVDMNAEMMRATLAVIGKTMFDADVEQDAGVVSNALETIFKYDERYIIAPIGKVLDALNTPGSREFYRAVKALDDTMYRIIDEHRTAEHDKGTLLAMLLEAVDDEGTGMTNQQLRDECITLFLAGHETTAIALTWTWYLLSQHPEVDAKLHEELARVLGDRPPTADDYPSLEYTRMIFSESMRLYPPAYAFGRQCIADTTIGGQPVRKGDTIFASTYVTQRDPRWFPEPDRFDPERWRPEAVETRPKFSYFPFGGGIRKCIGEPFAWMEGVLMLASLARKWRADLDTAHTPALDPKVTLRPKGGMPMYLRRR